MLLFLIITFICLNVQIHSKDNSIYVSFTKALIILSLEIVVLSEVTSYLNIYNYYSISIFWILNSILLIFLSNKKIISYFASIWNTIINNKKTTTLFLIALLILFIQGILYPPNNWDSMTYHMARISHWVMNSSIYPYPTHIYRQIYQPPLAELIIAQICILFRSDLLANNVQLLFTIGIVFYLNEIGNLLKLPKKTKLVSVVLTLTTPIVLLESTSTQNDIVICFYCLGIIYYCIDILQNKTNCSKIILTSSTIGLCLLTKGTSFIYIIPIVIYILFYLGKLIKRDIVLGFNKIRTFIIILLISILIPFGHYYRNFNLSGSIFGNSEDNYFNQKITLSSYSVSLIKNVANQFGFPLTYKITNIVIEKLHLVTGIKIDDKNYNFKGVKFKLSNWNNNEDNASNIIHIIIFLTIFPYIIYRNKNKKIILKWTYLFCSITFLIFCFILKWQPWHTRLLLPFFVFTSIPISIFLEQYKLRNNILYTCILYGIIIVIFNPNRPLIINYKNINSRFDKYFILAPKISTKYKSLRMLVTKNYKANWEGHEDTWEYPLYYDCFNKKRKPFKSINIKNPSNKLNINKTFIK